MARSLRAVTPGDSAPKLPITIKAAADISERALLVALRNKLADQLDGGEVPAHAIRGLVAELRDVDKNLRALDQRQGGSESVVADTDDEPFSP